LEIFYLKSVNSTHKYLQDYISKNGYTNPIAVFTKYQLDGIGSRDNSWIGKKDNFYLSFVIDKDLLPNDLKIQSASIYFSYILKEIFENKGSKVFLKWPNDFYIDDKKIGGTITTLKSNLLYCGIGINLKNISDDFGHLDILIDIEEVLSNYFNSLEKYPKWKYIFSKYLIEFHLNKKYFVTVENRKVSMKDSILNNDGSLQIDNKKVFSSR
jgi:BirA family biotin operon repressor/biotin-[acetyl-CoA-carboxylase] ligase